MEIPNETYFWWLIVLDSFYIDFLIRGDQPGYKPYLYLLFCWVISLWQQKSESNTDRFSDRSNDDPAYVIWDTSRPETFTATGSTPIEEILRSQAQAAKNLALNRDAERVNAQAQIDYAEDKLERFGFWRSCTKGFGVIFLALHCCFLYHAVKEVVELRHFKERTLQLQRTPNQVAPKTQGGG